MYEALVPSRCCGAHQLKVDFISPLSQSPQFSPLVTVALSCVAVIMEVITRAPCLFHSAAAAQAGFDTMTLAAQPHPHTLRRITGPAHCHTQKHTVFVYKVIKSIWIYLSFTIRPLFIQQGFFQA